MVPVSSRHPAVATASAPRASRIRNTARPYHSRPRSNERCGNASARRLRPILIGRTRAGAAALHVPAPAVTQPLLTLADWFSLVRIPLGALFLFVAGRLPFALGILVLA